MDVAGKRQESRRLGQIKVGGSPSVDNIRVKFRFSSVVQEDLPSLGKILEFPIVGFLSNGRHL